MDLSHVGAQSCYPRARSLPSLHITDTVRALQLLYTNTWHSHSFSLALSLSLSLSLSLCISLSLSLSLPFFSLILSLLFRPLSVFLLSRLCYLVSSAYVFIPAEY